MKPKWLGGAAAALVASGGVLLSTYLLRLRSRRGATAAEVERDMPENEVVPQPTFNGPRAVIIRARPEEIWPGLVRMGRTRAGAYGHNWIDNARIPSDRRITSELQSLAGGEFIPLTPDGKQGGSVNAIEPREWILWAGMDGVSG
jgi:hypothetical protein